MKRLISRDSETGRETYFHAQNDGDRRLWIIESKQDVSKFIERAKQLSRGMKRQTPWGEGQKVATIPLVILERLKQEGISTDPARMKRWLNDPDNRHFRTRPGRV